MSTEAALESKTLQFFLRMAGEATHYDDEGLPLSVIRPLSDADKGCLTQLKKRDLVVVTDSDILFTKAGAKLAGEHGFFNIGSVG